MGHTMLLSTEGGSSASSSAKRCCRLPADSGFSHIQASMRDSVMLEVCRHNEVCKQTIHCTLHIIHTALHQCLGLLAAMLVCIGHTKPM